MLRGLTQVLGLMALSVGCSQVLGIEDAHVDSALLGGGGGVASPSSTMAGTVSAAGEPETPGSVLPSGGSGGGGGSAGSAATVAEAGADTSEGGAPPGPTLCESYCDAMMSNCKGKYEQYRTFDQCVEVCKRLPEGTSGDENVNSVQCRVRQASFAEAEPFVYCKSAGPLGAGKCGSNCVAYCSLMQTTCTADSTVGNLELSYFADSQACLSACGAIPTHEEDPVQYSSSATASPSCFVGNTVYCRMYHVAAALEQDTPDEHCPHAMGGDPCNDP
jgi:hypothetical protein